jgi:glycosyltransferase involved in cell wall biosynthesis
MKSKRPIALVSDRVMHFNIATWQAVERRLAERGIEFHVLSSSEKAGSVGRVGESKAIVTNHHHFKELREWRVRGFMLRHQVGMLDLIKQIRPAVVMSGCHSGTFSEWQLLSWAQRNSARRVAWQCGYEYNPGWIKETVLSRFVPRFDFHLCYHTNAQKYALAHGARLEQTLVMHNTIDESLIVPLDPDEARAGLVAQYPALRGKKILLYVGAVLEEKRLEVVFEAMNLLNDPQIAFLIVGDGPHLEVLRQQYGGRSNWVGAGRVVEGVGRYFDAANAFVLPGTGGLAINEAMAHRLPLISGYADGSADDLVEDGQTGYRLVKGTPVELAEHLRAMLSDSQKAQAMGLEGERRIRGRFSFESFVKRVVDTLVAQHALAGSD